MLKADLGVESYKSEIRTVFTPAATCRVSALYKSLMKIKSRAIVTLNVDRLVARAFSEANPGKAVTEFSGKEIHNFIHVLKDSKTFIANLHGNYEDEHSWVFTREELAEIAAKRAYDKFRENLLMQFCVVFVGISIEDTAVGGYLEELTRGGTNSGGHFYLTSKKDTESVKWAETNGVRSVLYSPENNHEQLVDLINSLVNYVSKDEEPVPIATELVAPRDSIRGRDEMSAERDLEKLRNELNSYARHLLKIPSKEAYIKYFDFLSHYDRSVHAAWYTSVFEPDNKLFGYQLVTVVGEGGFGKVYEAISPGGETVAVKVLHPEVRNKKEMLQCFRRGVNSMKILSDANISGMVKHLYSAEIPACTVMEFVYGSSLAQVVSNGKVRDWAQILDIAYQVARIIECAHKLPQRVLHRDIRPQNIMLDGFYDSGDNIKVVVLDFDLSWHEDATEVTISHIGSANPYLAPEQISPTTEHTTRSALVDSFGLAMTLFFLRTSKPPLSGQYRHADWARVINSEITSFKCTAWKSAPKRYARLITSCTSEKQSARPDMSQIANELNNIQLAMRSPENVRICEFVAEELMALATLGFKGNAEYMHNPNNSSFKVEFQSGLSISLTPDETLRKIVLCISFSDLGTGKYESIKKFVPHEINTITGFIKSCGWSVDQGNKAVGYVSANFRANVDDALRNREKLSNAVVKTIEAFSRLSTM